MSSTHIKGSLALVSRTLIAFFLITHSSIVCSSPDPKKVHQKCRNEQGMFACVAHPIKNETPIYAHPSRRSMVLKRAPLGSSVSLLATKESERHPGWIPVYTLHEGKRLAAWVNHADVVLATELREVVSCWPVKTVSWYEKGYGDYTGGENGIRFTPHGALADPKTAKIYALYYKRGVFRVMHRYDPYAPAPVPVFVLDYEACKVRFSAQADKASFELFPKAQQEGCEEIPKIAPSKAPKFKL